MDSKMESKVELWLSASNLVDKDWLSKSDPFVVIYEKIQGKWAELGRTETVSNNLNPEFKKRFIMSYRFEEFQELKVEVYDSDSNSKDLSAHQLIGETRTSLASVVSAHSQKSELVLFTDHDNPGKRKQVNDGKAKVIVRCEELIDSNETISISMSAKGLDKMDFFGGSDPYVIISKMTTDDSKTSWVEVHRTEIVKSNLNPSFKLIRLSMSMLCNGDRFRALKFSVWDWDRNSDHDLIGEVETNVTRMLETVGQPLTVINPEKAKDKGAKYTSKGSGQLIFNKIDVERQWTFLDYVRGGLQISLMCAIDYTGSNGHPQDPKSLHYLQSGQLNQYATAISTIGSVLAPYDSDNKYPLWGFGGRLNATNRVEHCFAVNMQPNPEVQGVNGMLDAYYKSFQHVVLSGPTFFDPILRTATAIASSAAPNTYYVLLILTDGVINDMPATIDSLVRASGLPLSVIIVGVGQADFSNMEALDGDDQGLRDQTGRLAQRDIVQFVPFNEVSKKGPVALATETLKEVPAQLLAWARKNNVEPPRAPASQSAAATPPAYAAKPQEI